MSTLKKEPEEDLVEKLLTEFNEELRVHGKANYEKYVNRVLVEVCQGLNRVCK